MDACVPVSGGVDLLKDTLPTLTSDISAILRVGNPRGENIDDTRIWPPENRIYLADYCGSGNTLTGEVNAADGAVSFYELSLCDDTITLHKENNVDIVVDITQFGPEACCP